MTRPRSIVVAAIAGMLLALAGAEPAAAAPSPPPSPSAAVADCLASPAFCYSPDQFRVAYGIRPLLDRGLDGRGRTVTVFELAPPPSASPPQVTDVRQDLDIFDTRFGLPKPRIQVVTTLAGGAAPWLGYIEEAEDTEIIHAVAPGAALRVVMIPNSTLDSAAEAVPNVLAGMRLAAADTDVVSISASLGEHFFSPSAAAAEHAVVQDAARRHITVVASSGDQGAVSDAHFGAAPVAEVSMPASDPLVLGAGGTALTATRPAGVYVSETAWNTPAPVQGGDSVASGGGFSGIFSRPAYQNGVPGVGATRGVPDVSGDADGRTGMTMAIAGTGQDYYLAPATGTSASAPLWAGLVAIADQEAGRDLGVVDPAIYRIARGPLGRQAFHDVTAGDNTVVASSRTFPGHPATPGWDAVTGWGSPDAGTLVPLLAAAPTT